MKAMTTGQVAKIFQCSPQLVARMVDDGKLEGHKLVYSKHRRINPASVLQAAKDSGMPIVGELATIEATLEAERESAQELLDNAEAGATITVE